MKIAKIMGINVSMQFATIITIVFIGIESTFLYQRDSGETDLVLKILFGTLSGLIMILSVLIHELAHALVAKSNGLEVKSINLNVVGGATQMDREPETPFSEIKMAGSGPLASVLLGGIFSLLYLIFSGSFPKSLFFYLGLANFSLGLFNLIPAFPIDGGRVLRAIIWKKNQQFDKATLKAAQVGVFFSSFVILLGIVLLFLNLEDNLLFGIYLMFIGYVIGKRSKQAHKIAYTQNLLSRITIGSLMKPLSPHVSLNVPIVDVVRNMFGSKQHRVVIVTENDHIIGFFHKEQLPHLSLDIRKTGTMKDAHIPLKKIPAMSLNQTAKEMVELLRKKTHEIDIVVIINPEKKILGYVDLIDVEIALNPRK